VKTAIANGPNLIVEGCYIPFDWEKDFDETYRKEIRYVCLIMSRRYIETHFADIRNHANAIEARLDDSGLSAEQLIADNEYHLTQCAAHGCRYIWIDEDYEVNICEDL
jgi:hypothetical protein